MPLATVFKSVLYVQNSGPWLPAQKACQQLFQLLGITRPAPPPDQGRGGETATLLLGEGLPAIKVASTGHRALNRALIGWVGRLKITTQGRPSQRITRPAAPLETSMKGSPP